VFAALVFRIALFVPVRWCVPWVHFVALKIVSDRPGLNAG